MSLREKRETCCLLSQLVGKEFGSLALVKRNVCSVLSLYTFPQQNNHLGVGLGGAHVGAGAKPCSGFVVSVLRLSAGFQKPKPFSLLLPEHLFCEVVDTIGSSFWKRGGSQGIRQGGGNINY